MAEWIENAIVWLTLKYAWLFEPGFRRLHRATRLIDRWEDDLYAAVIAADLEWIEPVYSETEGSGAVIVWWHGDRHFRMHLFHNGEVLWVEGTYWGIATDVGEFVQRYRCLLRGEA